MDITITEPGDATEAGSSGKEQNMDTTEDSSSGQEQNKNTQETGGSGIGKNYDQKGDSGDVIGDTEDIEEDAGDIDDQDGKSGNECEMEQEEDEDNVVRFRPISGKFASTTQPQKEQANSEAFAFDAVEFGVVESDLEKSSSEGISKDLGQEAEKWMPAHASATAVVNKTRRFICIDYPGLIKNKEKAIATLGGLKQIVETAKKEDKLELNFRPDDPFCKSVIGLFTRVNNLLIRCKRRKLPMDSASSSDGDGYEYKIEVLGVVDGLFDFKAPADYQFLPLVKEKDGSLRELLTDIMIKFEDERTDYLSRDVPLFLPPFTFSRRETPAKYFFQPDPVEEEEPDAIIATARKSRSIGTQNVTFWDNEVPDKPSQDCMMNVGRYNPVTVKNLTEHLEKLFDKRPMWTKSAILCNTPRETHHLIKIVLPTLAYNMLSGPWRTVWVKLGFAPKKQPESKQYQVIDFRLRSNLTKQKVQLRKDRIRSFPHWNVKSTTTDDITTTTTTNVDENPSTSQTLAEGETKAGDRGDGSSPSEVDFRYQYVPWKIPPYRHMLYQVCDVFEEQIQTMLHQNDGQEKECTEKDGWCIPAFTDLSRDILMSHTDRLLS